MMQAIEVTVIKPKRGPYPSKPRQLLVPAELIAEAVKLYKTRIAWRPAGDRAMHALMACAQAFDVPFSALREPETPAHTALRQQSLAFARAISLCEGLGPVTHWTRIGRAFNCNHYNALYAHRVYGAALHIELQRIMS